MFVFLDFFMYLCSMVKLSLNTDIPRKEAQYIFYKFMRRKGDTLIRFLLNHCRYHHLNIPKRSGKDRFPYVKILDNCFYNLIGKKKEIPVFMFKEIICSGDSAFYWDEAPEGEDFWIKADKDWRDYVSSLVDGEEKKNT